MRTHSSASLNLLRWPGALLLTGIALTLLAGACRPPDVGAADRGSGASAPPGAAASPARVEANYGRLPLAFEPNRGQFVARTRGYTLALTGHEAVLRMSSPLRTQRAQRRPSDWQVGAPSRGTVSSPTAAHFPSPSASSASSAVTVRLLNANPGARVAGEAPLPGRSNYFIGSDPSHWRTNVPHFAKVRAQAVYPGIDAVYYGNHAGRLEYDFEVAPGADPVRIRLAFSGADRIEMDPDGDLLIHTAAGLLRQQKPVAYQVVSGQRRHVDARYALVQARPGLKPGSDVTKPAFPGSHPTVRAGRLPARSGGACSVRPGFQSRKRSRPHTETPTQISFRLGPYDRSRPLVIDPVLVYSTYLGGTFPDDAFAVAVDGLGNAYVAGRTVSSVGFPATAGAYDTSHNGVEDAFVAKLDPTGQSLLYCTYYGGTSNENAHGIAVDAAGNAYVVGWSQGGGIPLVDAYQPTFQGGGGDAFVFRLNAAGSSVDYASYLGGTGNEDGNGIAADSAGYAYITGSTASNDFPMLTPVQADHAGNGDAFVAKFDTTAAGAASLVYATYLGGSSSDTGYGVAVDAAGNAHVTGLAISENDFPTTAGAFQRLGAWNTFVSKLSPAGNALLYSTYLGGTGAGGWGGGIAVDDAGHAYVTGGTGSLTFPTTAGAYQRNSRGGFDAYVTKLNPQGSALVYSTYVGGDFADNLEIGSGRIAIDTTGAAYVTGQTQSDDFPTVNALQDVNRGGINDIFVFKLNAAGSALHYCTDLGGTGNENAPFGRGGIAVDGAGNAYVVGGSSSDDFPTASPLQPARAGSSDGVVVKLGANTPAPPGNLQVTGVTSSRVSLYWGDYSGNETHFEVERRTDSVGWARVASPPAGATAHNDNTALSSTTYYYRVRAANGEGASAPSNEVEATTLQGGVPAAPDNLVADAVSMSRIDLTWWDNSSNEDGFRIERTIGNGAFIQIATIGMGEETYSDTGLAAATLHTYRVRAYNVSGNSTYSNEAYDTTLPPPPPAAPSGLVGTPLSATQVSLGWTDNSLTEQRFDVERKTVGGEWGPVRSVLANVNQTVDDVGVLPSTSYLYRVRAANAGGVSEWSNEAPATTPTGGTGTGRLVAAPRRVAFPLTTVGQIPAPTRIVTLRNAGRGTYFGTIEAFTVGPFAIVEGGGAFALAPGTTRVVTIEFGPTARGTSRGSLRVTTTTPRARGLNVPVSGRGREPE